MARLLTHEEWRLQMPPMAYTRIKYESWTDTHFDIAEKFILENCDGWVWFKRRDKMFVFGTKGDAALFDLWLEEDILSRDRGFLDGKESR